MVKQLIESGADLNAINKFNNTALNLAIVNGIESMLLTKT